MAEEARLSKKDFFVADVDLRIARQMVRRLHYSRGGSNTATYLHGLFHKDEPYRCLGVAWWIPPTRSSAESTYPDNWKGVLALSRMAIEPEVPRNAASFLLAGSRKLIDRHAWPCLVTYADEWRGHTGGIYRADNWNYCGKTAPEQVWTIGERMVARKAGPKTRTSDEMKALGARLVGRFSKHKFVHIVEGVAPPPPPAKADQATFPF